MKWHLIAHGLIAGAWVGALAIGGIGLCQLGSQEHRIAARRGQVERELDVLEREIVQLGSALEVAGSRPRIEVAVRTLGLPIERPVELASR